jgi:hypothetical protein
MVSTRIIHFDAVCRGSLNWRVSVNGEDEHVPFACRDDCVAAARVRARQRHINDGIPTEVRVQTIGGGLESIVIYMKPHELDEFCLETESISSRQLREACELLLLGAGAPKNLEN